MLFDVKYVTPREGTTVYLEFEDGVSGTVDISNIVNFTGVFEPMKDPKFFRQVRVDPELGTIVWPNHADLCPDVLYSLVSGKPLVFAST